MGARSALGIEQFEKYEKLENHEKPEQSAVEEQADAFIENTCSCKEQDRKQDYPAPEFPAQSFEQKQEPEPISAPLFEPAFIPSFASSLVSEKTPAAGKTPVKTAKNTALSLQQKIQEAQKIQAEGKKNFRSTENNDNSFASSIPANSSIPIDAENIINLPLRHVEETEPDYSDEEERLNASLSMSAHTETMQALSSLDLFAEERIKEEEKEDFDWHAFLEFCALHEFPEEYIPLLQGLNIVLTKNACYIKVSSGPQTTIFNKIKIQLENLLCTFLQRTVKIHSTIVAYELTSDDELREKALNNPQIQMLINEFGAEIYRCYDIRHGKTN